MIRDSRRWWLFLWVFAWLSLSSTSVLGHGFAVDPAAGPGLDHSALDGISLPRPPDPIIDVVIPHW